MRKPKKSFVMVRGAVGVVLALWLSGCGELIPQRSPGEKLYRKHCADCHGIDGAGHTIRTMGDSHSNLIDDLWRHAGDPSGIENVIQNQMVFEHPTFGKLERQDIKQIVDHILRLRGERRN